jgi:hypothetical protein
MTKLTILMMGRRVGELSKKQLGKQENMMRAAQN